jgi:hypothetical protein
LLTIKPRLLHVTRVLFTRSESIEHSTISQARETRKHTLTQSLPICCFAMSCIRPLSHQANPSPPHTPEPARNQQCNQQSQNEHKRHATRDERLLLVNQHPTARDESCTSSRRTSEICEMWPCERDACCPLCHTQLAPSILIGCARFPHSHANGALLCMSGSQHGLVSLCVRGARGGSVPKTRKTTARRNKNTVPADGGGQENTRRVKTEFVGFSPCLMKPGGRTP